MKLLFVINTPSQVYFWGPIVRELQGGGWRLDVLARRYQGTVLLLRHMGIHHHTFPSLPTRQLKPLELGVHLAVAVRQSVPRRPYRIVGFGIDATIAARLLCVRSLVYVDGEHLGIQWPLLDGSGDVIVTPEAFRRSFARARHVRIQSYKELAYLHPDRFTPDASIYEDIGIGYGTPYAILRFSDLSSAHDRHQFGLSLADKRNLIAGLSRHVRVFISSEAGLPADLQSFTLSIPYHRIHHALAFAQLVVTDTGTMTTEAAVLGVPTVYCGSLANRSGVFQELAHRYQLLHVTQDPAEACAVSARLAAGRDGRQVRLQRLARLLDDKVDVCDALVRLLTGEA